MFQKIKTALTFQVRDHNMHHARRTVQNYATTQADSYLDVAGIEMNPAILWLGCFIQCAKK